MTDDVKLFVDRTLNIGVGLLSSIVTLASFVVDPVGPFERRRRCTCSARIFAIPGYLVWGALIYSVLGTVADPPDRLAAGRHRFPAAAVRGGFPLQPGARARKLRTDRAAATASMPSASGCSVRFGRVVDNWLAIMSRTKKLTAFTAELHQASVIFPYVAGGAGLLREQDPARRHDADRIGIFAACRARCRSSSPSTANWRNGRRWSTVSTGSRPGSRRRASLPPAATGFTSSRRRAAARSTSRNWRCELPNGTPLVNAEQFSLAQGRAHADDRPLRLRQIDAVPRHRRHLAVRRRARHHACRRDD